MRKMFSAVIRTVAGTVNSLLFVPRNIFLTPTTGLHCHYMTLLALRLVTRAAMSSELGGNLRKRMFGEAEDVEDVIQQKSLRADETDCSSCDMSISSSSSTSSLSSDDDKSPDTADVTSSTDAPIPFGALPDLLQLHSQADAWKYSKLCDRRWVYVDSGRLLHGNGGDDHCQQNGFKFTIASYNVLAQNLLEENSYLYSHCQDARCLEWSYRQKQLLAEITHYEPDILCCQEVNEQHYMEFFCHEMEKLGYEGSFKKRTRAMRDGCATFFKKSLFDCEASVPVEYLVPDVASLDRDNVALLLLLRPKCPVVSSEQSPVMSSEQSPVMSSEQSPVVKLCVANTHLLFNPRRGDVKLAQLMKLFAEIDRLTYQPCPAGPRHRNYHPVLVCGDMNAEPFSHLYRFIRRGKLVLDGQPAAKLSGQERRWSYGHRHPMAAGFLGKRAGLTDQSQYVSVCRERFNEAVDPACDRAVDDVPCETCPLSDADSVPGVSVGCTQEKPPIFTQGTGTVTHTFGLDSAYTHVMSPSDDKGRHHYKSAREVTTCHSRANCTVDYIFYTPSVSDVNHSGIDWNPCDSESQTTHSAGSDDAEQCKLSTSCDSALSTSNSKSRTDDVEQSSVSNSTSVCRVSDYRLTLVARLPLLSDKDMKRIGPLPNKFISSDHLMLAAQFLLTTG